VETATKSTAPSNGIEETDRILPDKYYQMMETVPPNTYGIERIRYYTGEVNKLPESVKAIVRERFNDFVREMVQKNASDLDMGGESCKGHLWYRVDGFKRPYPDLGEFTADESELFLLSLMVPQQQERLLTRFSIDFGYSLPIAPNEPDRRFRNTIFFDNKRLALSMRMLPWKPRPLRGYGFHPIIERGLLFRYIRDGITLITGVTGSGKSTTLDAIVNANNHDIEAQIIVIAQPLEYLHTSEKCIVRHREVGTDVASYVDGMVQALRQDPDMIVVGEMRDAESISTALEMADTGHKVFSTLHTGSAIETIDRIVAEYPTEEQDRVRNRIADVLNCIISQKLLPSVGGGRVLAKEVMWMTPSARAAIKNKNTGEVYQMMWAGADQGMTTLEQDLYRLVQNGDISPEVALSYANNKRRLLQIMN
jgi:twitching motility protein PilT